MKTTFLIPIVYILISCAGSTNENSDPETKAASKIEKVSWLIGEWHSSSEDGSVVEVWERYNDSVYVGRSYFIKDMDTVSYESLKIVQQGDELNYIPTVRNQNEGRSITFKLISLDSNKFVFENPSHDFPQIISYHKISDDSLLAEISGLIKGEHRAEQFPMRRVK